MSGTPVRFFSVRKSGATPPKYLTPAGDWVEWFGQAIVLTEPEADRFDDVPSGGELFEFTPGDIEDGGTTFSTVEVVGRGGPAFVPQKLNRHQRRVAAASHRKQQKGLEG